MKKTPLVASVACSLILHGLALLGGWMVLRSVLGSGRTAVIGHIISAEIFQQEQAVVAGPRPAVGSSPPSARKPAKKESVKNHAGMQPSGQPGRSSDQQGSAALTGAAAPVIAGPTGLPSAQTLDDSQDTPLESKSSKPAEKAAGGKPAEPAEPDEKIISKIHGIVSKSIVYPPSALRIGIEGVVKVSFKISQDGRPLEIRVDGTSGYGILDEAAVKAVEKGKSYPLIAKTVVIPVRFSLK